MIPRDIKGFSPDPQDNTRRIYKLECGHSVIRRTNASKRKALCGFCRSVAGGE